MDAHVRIFQRIAWIYRYFYGMQLRAYRDALERFPHVPAAAPGDSVLDIGCGTGALITALRERGYDAAGVDAAPNMVHQATAGGAPCAEGNAVDGLAFPDDSFDMVTMAYVAHGLEREKRLQLYREANRLARRQVLIHDYLGYGGIVTRILETLEGGTYYQFIQDPGGEMLAVFADVTVTDLGGNAAWYACTPQSEA